MAKRGLIEVFNWEAKGLEPPFDQATNARRVARNQAQKPGATRKIEDKRRKPPKHRKAQDVVCGPFHPGCYCD